jgi:four helix bundle suffix protein
MASRNDGAELIPKHGGYRKLKSFQLAQLVYDVTVRFCDRYVDGRSRTHDQMVQAARSGVQNIAEGSQVSGTSKKMEMKLTSVARASLEELRRDYEDFLRQKGLRAWAWEDRRRSDLIGRRPRSADELARWAREVHEGDGRNGRGGRDGQGARGAAGAAGAKRSGAAGAQGGAGAGGAAGAQGGAGAGGAAGGSPGSMPSIPSMGSGGATYPEIAANGALALIAAATSLLDRQLAAQAASFEAEGGFTERLYRRRTRRRGRGEGSGER